MDAVPPTNRFGPPASPDDVVPPTVAASPGEVPAELDANITWYRPSWTDLARHLGWRWILLSPGVLLLGLLVLACLSPARAAFLFAASFKLIVFFVGVAVSLAGWVVGRAVKGRLEPFCIFCGYNLSGLPDDHRCPECGRPYTWRLIAEYRRDPAWFVERYRASRKLPAKVTPFEAGKIRRPRSRDGAS